jgi:hypothetical protein
MRISWWKNLCHRCWNGWLNGHHTSTLNDSSSKDCTTHLHYESSPTIYHVFLYSPNPDGGDCPCLCETLRLCADFFSYPLQRTGILPMLIRKEASPREPVSFIPVESMCNVVYKIASEVLANRLKTILPEIILQKQSAFVLGRLITANIVTTCNVCTLWRQTMIRNICSVLWTWICKKHIDRVEW